MLDEFGVYLKPSTFGKDVKPFLKDACSQIFGSATGLVDMMIAHVPSSKAGAANKVSRTEKKRQEYAFQRQFNETPSVIPGCPAQGQQHCWCTCPCH